MTINECQPGQRIRVVQTIDRREGDWKAEIIGTIVSVENRKTESWYAHSKDNKYWLLRVHLRKDDGEESLLNLDGRTEVELLGGPTPNTQSKP